MRRRRQLTTKRKCFLNMDMEGRLTSIAHRGLNVMMRENVFSLRV